MKPKTLNNRDENYRKFIRALALFLTGSEMNKELFIELKAVGIPGCSSVNEAEKILTKLLIGTK